MEQEINSKVWQMHGILAAPLPGVLLLQKGNVSFITEKGEQFKVSLAEVKEVKWPFLQFGLGFNANVNGQQYKFTFMKPNGASDLNDSTLGEVAEMTSLGRGMDAMETLSKWGDNKTSAKQWKAILGG